MIELLGIILFFASKPFAASYRRALPILATLTQIFLALWAIAWLATGAFSAILSPGAFFQAWVGYTALGTLAFLLDLIWVLGPTTVFLLASVSDFLGRHKKGLTGGGLVVSIAGFGGLTFWSSRLPVLPGFRFSPQETFVRGGAILFGVASAAFLVGTLFPLLLDLLEKRSFVPTVASRHVRTKKSGFLTVISTLSILSVALSSCSLCGVTSMMGGFSSDLKRKILGNSGHIVVDQESAAPFGGSDDLLTKLRASPKVVGATPVVQGEAMAQSRANLAGVIVRGIDPATHGTVTELANNVELGKFEWLENPEILADLPPETVIGVGPKGEPFHKGVTRKSEYDKLDPAVRDAIKKGPDRAGIVVGRELAKTLQLFIGDEVTLVSPMGDLGPMGILPRTRRFRVAGIFFSGMYEYDASHVYVTLGTAQEFFGTGDKIHAIDVKVEDADRVDLAVPDVTAVVGASAANTEALKPEAVPEGAPKGTVARPGTGLRLRDWRDINKNLFSALKLEKFVVSILLTIAVIVASFCIVCTLLLMVTEKGREIAILKALGATDGSILRLFMLEGTIIGAFGSAFGVATGLALVTGVKWFGLKLDPDVYYIDKLPVAVNPSDFVVIGLGAMAICTLSTFYPAWAASRLRPVDGLRNS